MINVSKNRRERKWSKREIAGRVVWAMARPLFLLSPRIFWSWRRFLLRLFGARIGSEVHIYPTVRINIPWNIDVGDQAAIGDRAILYALGPIKVGCRSTISQGAHLCAGTHDINDPERLLVKLPITIGDDVWICAEAFIGPGVNVGNGAIVGARAVSMKDVEPHAVVVGNPAKIIRRM